MNPFLFIFAAAIAGELTVTSNVDGLSIVVNGEDTGKTTPAVLRNVKSGRATVQVGDLCRSGEAMVEVRADADSEVEVFAEEQMAMLTVSVRPAQATVDVNDGDVRISPNVPVGLPCGIYEISAKLKGYSTASYALELIGGQELELPIELEKLGISTVEFSVTPRSGTLYFDDREVGQDAASLPSVYEGRHTIGARAKGYNDVEATVDVGGGDGLVFRIELGRGDDAGNIVAVGSAGKTALARGAKAEDGGDAEDEEDEEDAALKDKPDAREEEPEAEPEEEPEDPDAPEEEPEEPDGDLAPVKSWSERHGADAEPADKRKKEVDLDEPEGPKNPKAGVRAAGGVLVGVGAAVAGGGGIYAWTLANEAYGTWSQMNAAAADAKSETDQRRLQFAADDYYTEEFAPLGNLSTGLFAGGGVLIATGVVLFLVDEGGAPMILPVPGGGLLGWSGSF